MSHILIFLLSLLICLLSLYSLSRYYPVQLDTLRTDDLSAERSEQSNPVEDLSKEELIRNFENQTIGCTVKLVETTKLQSSGTSSKRSCTHEDFDKYFLETHQFHGEGTWFAANTTHPDRHIQYRPTLCEASQQNVSLMLPECLKEKVIKKILITGDSNGRFFKDGILEVLASAGYICQLRRSTLMEDEKGNLVRDWSYLDVPGVNRSLVRLPITMFAEVGWSNREYQCQHLEPGRTEQNVSVEYIHGGYIHDTALHLSPNLEALSFKERSTRADSKLEYLLKYYYPYHGFPDLWFFTLPYHIMAITSSLQSLELDLHVVLRQLAMYVPPSTELVFLSDATVCPDENMQQQYIGDFQRRWHMMMDEKIHHMNQVLFKMLVPQLTSHKNYHVFVDASRVACPVTCIWHKDGAHMLPVWYYKMAEYNFNLSCV